MVSARASTQDRENLAARINSEFNARHQRGDNQRLDREVVEQHAGSVRRATANGRGSSTMTGRWTNRRFCLKPRASCSPRRAAPGDPGVRALCRAGAWLAGAETMARAKPCRRPGVRQRLRLTDEIEAAGPLPEPSGIGQFLFCRATALQGLGRTNEATACIEGFSPSIRTSPKYSAVAAQLHLQSGRYQAALAVLDRLLSSNPATRSCCPTKAWPRWGWRNTRPP